MLQCLRRHISSVKLSANVYKNVKAKIKIDASLIIMHGLLGSKQNWNSIAKNLSSEFRDVATVDLRNHGDSAHSDDVSIEAMSSDVSQYLESSGLSRPILLGHSLGGKVAMHLALTRPLLLSGLVVVDVAPVPTEHIRHYKAFIEGMVGANIDQSLSLPANRRNIDRQLEAAVQDSGVRSFLLTNLVREGEGGPLRWRANLGGLLRGLDRLVAFEVPAGARYAGPALFVAGGASDYLGEAHLPAIQALFPAARLEVVPGAGHWVQADQPHRLIALLTAFGAEVAC